jgi:hypothetical protein
MAERGDWKAPKVSGAAVPNKYNGVPSFRLQQRFEQNVGLAPMRMQR